MERGEYNSAQLQLQHNAHTQSVVDVVCMNFSGVNLQLSQFSYALFYTACVHITKKMGSFTHSDAMHFISPHL